MHEHCINATIITPTCYSAIKKYLHEEGIWACTFISTQSTLIISKFRLIFFFKHKSCPTLCTGVSHMRMLSAES